MPKPLMKCPNCGAQITEETEVCEFCGTQFEVKKPKIEPVPVQQPKEEKQERVSAAPQHPRKGACPNCGSNNVTFSREKQAELKEDRNSTVVRKTVGLCKDCGYTWNPEDQPPKKKRKTWLWVLGWLFIFPVPLTILMLQPERTLDKEVRYAIIAAAWILFAIFVAGSKNQNSENSQKPAVESTSNFDINTLYV